MKDRFGRRQSYLDYSTQSLSHSLVGRLFERGLEITVDNKKVQIPSLPKLDSSSNLEWCELENINSSQATGVSRRKYSLDFGGRQQSFIQYKEIQADFNDRSQESHKPKSTQCQPLKLPTITPYTKLESRPERGSKIDITVSYN